jgi:cytochrome c oxidase subunit 2
MQSRFQGIRARAAGLAAGAMAAFWSAGALAQDLVGQPTDGAIDLQPGVTPLRDDAIFFHNTILMPIVTAIVLLVLGLLAWIVIRYNKKSNPVPARWSHNTPIEIIWTLAPVLILVFISIFSFKLLFAYHDMPKPDLTIKATGYQWYWGYEYPDAGVPEFVSNILPEDQAKAKGVPYKLAATEPLVVPVNKVVRVLVTGADVIHAFAVPSFGIITDAVPGRVNETWFKADRIGTFYGSCRELCGIDHAFMPIEVHVVSDADYAAWLATKATKKPAETPTTLNAQADAASPPANATAAGQPAAATAPANPAAPAPAAVAPTATPAASTVPAAPKAPAAR